MSEAGADDDLLAAARRLLEAHGTATLATTNGREPWAAAVFYAADADLNLYFVSDPATRHGRDLAANGEVAVAVHADCTAWSEVCGLQLRGRACLLDGAGRDAAMALYLAKFADVRRLFEAPANDDEAAIGRRLRAAGLYRFTPAWLRVIDNRRGFGARREAVLA
jgi:hypothetical protein